MNYRTAKDLEAGNEAGASHCRVAAAKARAEKEEETKPLTAEEHMAIMRAEWEASRSENERLRREYAERIRMERKLQSTGG